MKRNINISLLSFATLTPTMAQQKTNVPNIIIIFADDLGYGDLSCYGHPTIHTPNLDRMAEEGMKCTQFYVAASVSTPSRAGLLTGRYPYRYDLCTHGGVLFPKSKTGLSTNEVTIAKALKQKDYKTACIGKWHLGDSIPWLPLAHGFDYFFGLPYSNDMSPAQTQWEKAKRFPLTPLIENNKTIEEEPDQRYLTKRYTEKAIEFIKKNKSDKFFLYLPYNAPHTPLYVSEKFAGSSKRGLYGDVVQEIDWSVGEVFKTLRDLKLDKNTLVIFTSDNGPWLYMGANGGSAGPLRNGKGTCYEGGQREPALFWWQGVIKPGSVNDGMMSTLDLFPTIMQITGIPMPENREYDGVNQLALLKGEGKSLREIFYYYSGDQLYAVRKGPWKLHIKIIDNPYGDNMELYESSPPRLYNVETDLGEQYNVSKQNPQIVKDLKQIADERLKTHSK